MNSKKYKKIACESIKNNFYITIPKKFNSELIEYNNGKFVKCCVKCGEMIKESFEERYNSTKYAGGMSCLYEFYIEPSKIDSTISKNYDKLLFGFQNLKKIYNKTIWKHGEKKVIAREKDSYGTEYIDVANLINCWLDNSDKYVLNNAYNNETDKEQNNAVICVLKNLFEKNFCKMVDKYTNEINSIQNKKAVKLFSHQSHVLVEIYKMCNKGFRNIITQLPPRFGKTLTWLTMFKESDTHKIMLVTSYVKTVGASYIKEALKYKDFEDMQIVDIDDSKNFRYNGNKIIIVMPTTGNEKTITNRVYNLKRIIKMSKIKSNEIFLLNEEADYGNHTDKTNLKFETLVKEIDKKHEAVVISTTGTDAFKAEKISAFGKIDGYLSVNKNDWSQIII